MSVWNVLPPCVATVVAIAFVVTVSVPMAAALMVLAGILVLAMFRLAASGRPLHHEFADRAAAVDGEMGDIVGNMPLVWSFCGLGREHRRLDATIDREIMARRRSLLYLEKLRLFHAAVTVVLTIALLAWAIVLWQNGAASTGDVVLVCTLGLSILHATRDLAVALVDVTQHLARLSEALTTLLIQHRLRDHPRATSLVRPGATVAFENIAFCYPDGRRVFTDFSLQIEPGQRVGLVGPSGCGKSTLFVLLQRFYDVQGGRILLGGQDIARVTQESLRSAVAVVPQDISLFHRSIMENIRYGRPEASDAQVHEAIVAANCSAFIENLPEGVATIVGDRGVKLSPGQRQRIGIARAFLKDAPILLLDEATSALDSESEEAVRDALDRLMGGRTVVAIAHRGSSWCRREKSARTARRRCWSAARASTAIWCGKRWRGCRTRLPSRISCCTAERCDRPQAFLDVSGPLQWYTNLTTEGGPSLGRNIYSVTFRGFNASEREVQLVDANIVSAVNGAKLVLEVSAGKDGIKCRQR